MSQALGACQTVFLFGEFLHWVPTGSLADYTWFCGLWTFQVLLCS